MALPADKVPKKAQIFQCNNCRFFGQGPQVRGHVLARHVATSRAPFHCLPCEFKGELLSDLEKHAATPRHRARAIMLSEDERASALGRGDWAFVAGPNGDATPWGRGLSTRFWRSVSQLGGGGPVSLSEEDLVWRQPRQLRQELEEEFVVPVEAVQQFVPEILVTELSPLPEDRVPPPAAESTRVVPDHVALPEVDVAAPEVISVTPVPPSRTEPAAVPETEPSAPVASATSATPALPPVTPELASSSLGARHTDTAVLAAEMASKLMRPLLEEVSSKLLSPVLDRMERQSTQIQEALCAKKSRSRSPAHHRRETHSSRSGHKSSKRDRASSEDDRRGKKKK